MNASGDSDTSEDDPDEVPKYAKGHAAAGTYSKVMLDSAAAKDNTALPKGKKGATKAPAKPARKNAAKPIGKAKPPAKKKATKPAAKSSGKGKRKAAEMEDSDEDEEEEEDDREKDWTAEEKKWGVKERYVPNTYGFIGTTFKTERIIEANGKRRYIETEEDDEEV